MSRLISLKMDALAQTKGQVGVCEEWDFGMVDSNGNGCAWYADNAGSCGANDCEDSGAMSFCFFASSDMCCACGGGMDWEALYA